MDTFHNFCYLTQFLAVFSQKQLFSKFFFPYAICMYDHLIKIQSIEKFCPQPYASVKLQRTAGISREIYFQKLICNALSDSAEYNSKCTLRNDNFNKSLQDNNSENSTFDGDSLRLPKQTNVSVFWATDWWSKFRFDLDALAM